MTAAPDTRVHTPSLLACHDCDLLLSKPAAMTEMRLRCPRCGHTLLHIRRNALQRTLACALTALMLFLPACMLPLLTITIAGQTHATNLINGIQMLAAGSYLWVALAVAFSAVLAPALELLLLVVIVGLAMRRRTGLFLARLIRTQRWLTHWGMLDVYLVGVLISIVKLVDLGQLVVGPGLASFVGLLLCATLANANFSPAQIWELFDAPAT